MQLAPCCENFQLPEAVAKDFVEKYLKGALSKELYNMLEPVSERFCIMINGKLNFRKETEKILKEMITRLLDGIPSEYIRRFQRELLQPVKLGEVATAGAADAAARAQAAAQAAAGAQDVAAAQQAAFSAAQFVVNAQDYLVSIQAAHVEIMGGDPRDNQVVEQHNIGFQLSAGQASVAQAQASVAQAQAAFPAPAPALSQVRNRAGRQAGNVAALRAVPGTWQRPQPPSSSSDSSSVSSSGSRGSDSGEENTGLQVVMTPQPENHLKFV